MTTQCCNSMAWATGCVLLLLACAPAASAPAVVEHRLHLRLDPAAGELQGRDRVTLPEGVPARFSLRTGLTPRAQVPLLALGATDGGLRQYAVRLADGVRSFEITYEGRLPGQDGQSDAQVSAQQVVLAPGSGWYPQFGNVPVRFSLEIALPAGWHSVSQGRSDKVDATGVARWRADTPQRGIWLVAAPFSRYQRDSAWGRAEIYLREADADLARQYLDATVDYLRLYSRLLGAYPYPKFALVENLHQTGYGMPSFTLLGSRVIRLPFIVHTSYPHEILHNWWGNGVWVDDEQGNWAEALTTYLADYLLAEQRGRGLQHRRAALQKYADFVAEHNDFPLRRFRSRHGEASQAVGYSKGMFLFHMLRRQLGDAVFVEGLRQFYRQYLFREAGFADLRRVFEQVGGVSLEAEFSQWLERTGAPHLLLEHAQVRVEDDGSHTLELALRQDQPGPAYRLQVPVAVQLPQRPTPLLQTFTMDAKSQRFSWSLPARPLRVAVDPAFDLFRRLHPEESPPTLGGLLGAAQALFVWPADAEPGLQQAYRDLAAAWAGPGDRIVSDRQLQSLPPGAVWLLGAENRLLPAFQRLLRAYPVSFGDAGVTLEEQRWPPSEYSLALAAAQEGQGARAWIAAPTPDAVAALARKLPHYSGYGFLAFAEPGTRNRLKGVWPVTASPLQRTLAADAPPSLVLPARPPLSAVLGPGTHAPP